MTRRIVLRSPSCTREAGCGPSAWSRSHLSIVAPASSRVPGPRQRWWPLRHSSRGRTPSAAIMRVAHHLPLPQIQPRRKSTSSAARASQDTGNIGIMTWNAGGLSSALYQELIVWCDSQPCLDIVAVQETHWQSTSDFFSGKWLAMHTAGSKQSNDHSRYGGILLLLNHRTFRDPQISELIPGRLLLVKATFRRSGLPCAIIGVYQHVWRSQLTTTENRDLGGRTWTLLNETLTKLPQRCEVFLCGI